MSLAKEAAVITSASRERQHAAYLRSREKTRQRSKLHRIEHKAVLRRKSKKYRRQLQSGMRVAHHRYHVGSSYVMGGARGRGELPGAKPMKVTRVQVV